MDNENAIDSNEMDAVIAEAGKIEVQQAAETVTDETITSGEPKFSTGEQLQPVLGLAFKVLTPNWNIQPEEVEVLAESYGEAIDFYWPEMSGGLPPWATPLIVTAAIIGPRASIPRKDEKEVTGEIEKDGESKG